MPTTARSILGWAVALPLLVAALLLVAAPGFMDPMFDPAMRIAGLPAGLVLLGAICVAIILGALTWRTVTRRAGPGLAGAITMVLVTVGMVVVPMVIMLLKNLES